MEQRRLTAATAQVVWLRNLPVLAAETCDDQGAGAMRSAVVPWLLPVHLISISLSGARVAKFCVRFMRHHKPSGLASPACRVGRHCQHQC